MVIKITKIMYAVLWSFSSVSIYVAFLIPANQTPSLAFAKRTLSLIGNYHLGVSMYMGMALIVVLLCRLFELIFCKIRKIELTKVSKKFHIRRSCLGVVYVSFIVFITLLGAYKAKDIKINRYDIAVDKKVSGIDELKVVLVADLHLGFNIGSEEMEKMVSLINKEQPDVVLVAGDIFDNDYESLDNPERLISILSSIDSTYGTYAVYGNHDIDEKILGGFTFNWNNHSKGSSEEMDEFLKRSGFVLLEDDYVLIEDSVYIYGRPDYKKPGKNITTRKTPYEIATELDLTKPVIVMDHEPYELSELAEAGIDVDLCGHTHDGQFFPMNLTSRYFTFENSAGLLKKGNMINIVTSGVGLFGPNIRIGTQAEVCLVTIHFAQ